MSDNSDYTPKFNGTFAEDVSGETLFGGDSVDAHDFTEQDMIEAGLDGLSVVEPEQFIDYSKASLEDFRSEDDGYDIEGKARTVSRKAYNKSGLNPDVVSLEKVNHALRDISAEQKPHLIGKMTDADLMAGRFKAMPYGVQSSLVDILTSPENAAVGHLSPLDVRGAKSAFMKMAGGEAAATRFLSNFSSIDGTRPSEVSHINPTTGKVYKTTHRHQNYANINIANSMLTKTSQQYLAKGAGETLAGMGYANSTIDESGNVVHTPFSQNQELFVQGHAAVMELSELAISGEITGKAREIAVKQFSEGVYKGLFDKHMYKGSESVIPLTTELPVSGAVPTRSAVDTSGYTRLGFNEKFDSMARAGQPVDDIFKAMNTPTSQATYFGSYEDPRTAKNSMKDRLHAYRETLHAEFPHHADESRGGVRTTQFSSPYGEQADAVFARDEAARSGIEAGFGNEATSDVLSGAHLSPPSATAGSGFASMLTSPNSSSDRTNYGASISAGGGSFLVYPTSNVTGQSSSGEEREFTIQHEGPPRLYSGQSGILRSENISADMQRSEGSESGGMHGARVMDDVGAYVEGVLESPEASNVVEGIPQRTAKWFSARKGVPTASKLYDHKKQRYKTTEELAVTLGMERFGIPNKPQDELANYWMTRGADKENRALLGFLNKMNKDGTPLVHKDVGLVKKDGNNFSVSPDGYLFEEFEDKSWRVDSLLELKYLQDSQITEKNKHKVIKKYEEQVQMQMLGTGADKAHFFALTPTGNSLHHVYHADEAIQKQIKEKTDKAYELSRAFKHPDEVGELDIQTRTQRNMGKHEGQQGSFTAAQKLAEAEAEDMTTSFAASNNTDNHGRRTFNVGAGGTSRDTIKDLKSDLKAEKDAETLANEKRNRADRDAAEATKRFTKELVGASSSLAKFAMKANDDELNLIQMADQGGYDRSVIKGLAQGLSEMV